MGEEQAAAQGAAEDSIKVICRLVKSFQILSLFLTISILILNHFQSEIYSPLSSTGSDLSTTQRREQGQK